METAEVTAGKKLGLGPLSFPTKPSIQITHFLKEYFQGRLFPLCLWGYDLPRDFQLISASSRDKVIRREKQQAETLL